MNCVFLKIVTPLQHSKVRYDFFKNCHFSLLERRPVKEIKWSIGFFELWTLLAAGLWTLACQLLERRPVKESIWSIGYFWLWTLIGTWTLDSGLSIMSYIPCLYDSVWLVTSHGYSRPDNHFRCVDLSPRVLMDNDNDNHLFLHLSPESRILLHRPHWQ